MLAKEEEEEDEIRREKAICSDHTQLKMGKKDSGSSSSSRLCAV